ncbi:LuxR C-terminal-related transcriptional regulator [Agrobacterium sp.]|jgi:DNA-binding CsgD family transcriptional regulator|uniref:LuxR C-terminal-related transcriptional regulator n=1 Tax=Agrobacterium sp. TaxID=361 RepID=UPI0028AABBDA
MLPNSWNNDKTTDPPKRAMSMFVRMVLKRMTMSPHKQHAGDFARPETLTDCEKTYLTMAAEGTHPSIIAKNLEKSEDEVQAALASARQKLGASNLLHAISIALLKGIIERDI